MPRRFVIILILTPLAIGGAMLWQKIWHGSVSNAPLTQRVYVWQRIQNVPAVATAVENVPRDMISGILPLVAEIHFRKGGDSPEIIRPALAMEAFQKREAAGNADAAVIRIGVSAAETGWSPAACERVSSLAREFLSSPTWAAKELQVDYDCPQKRLGDFGKLLAHLKKTFPENRITFTALPTWLRESEFAKIAAKADSYVLQVHSLQLPAEESDPLVLINPTSAREAVRRAGKLGQPFEVALPTYSCFVIFEAGTSRLVDVVSEDLPSQWPSHAGRVKLGRADPFEMAGLVREWRQSHPKAMSGLIWYRLPVATDGMNWPSPVWEKVVRGVAPIESYEFQIVRDKSRSIIVLKNTGETAVRLPEIVRLEIMGQGEFRFDGGKLYRGQGDPLEFALESGQIDHLPLPPGKAVEVGWIDGEVTVSVK